MDNFIVDREVRKLIPVISGKALEKLTNKLESGEETASLTIWRNIVCYGLDEYLICKEKGLSYDVEYKYFADREEMILWLCDKQLTENAGLFEPVKKYNVGKIFDIRRKDAIKLKPGSNQNTTAALNGKMTYKNLADELGDKYFMSYSTVEKYGRFAFALDSIDKVSTEFVDRILNGTIRVSHENLEKLGFVTPQIIEKVTESLLEDTRRKEQREKNSTSHYKFNELSDDEIIPKIKTTPEFDPDVEVNTLYFTVPNWKQTIERVNNSDLDIASDKAKERLIRSLEALMLSCTNIIEKLRRNNNE